MRRPARKLRELLGVNVRQLRLERQWSQDELSARSGLTQSYVSQVESGLRAVSIDALDQLARAFGEPPDRLLRR